MIMRLELLTPLVQPFRIKVHIGADPASNYARSNLLLPDKSFGNITFVLACSKVPRLART